MGFAITLQGFFHPGAKSLANTLIVMVFLGLYGFVLFSGLLYAERPHCTIPLLVAFGLQIPWISSPILSYHFSAGFHIMLGLMGGRINAGIRLGSDWQFGLFQQHPSGAGINVVALVLFVLIARIRK